MLGLPLERLEDERLLRGQGRYTDDLAVENTGHAVFIRSDRAHAVIQEIEKAAAERAPGVRLVLTGRDAAARELGQLRPMASVPGQIERTRPVIADETVRHVGEIVAMVVADTLDWARDAAEAIVVRTSDRPCAVEVAYDWHTGDADAVGRAFARAHTVARITTKSNRVVVHPLEPRCAIGWYDAPSGRYTLHTPTQGVHQVRDALADHVFAIERERIRVITEDVGGAFGMKLHPYPEHALVLLAARLTGAPVRWQATRSEAALADAHGRAQTLEGALALDAQGRFLALQVRNTADLGAYYSHFGPPTPSLSGGKVAGHCYRIEAVELEVRALLTNSVPVDAYRGAGKPEMVYLVERLVDRAAHLLNLDPAEIRMRNLLRPQDLPWRLPLGQEIDSGDFPEVLRRCVVAADRDGFEARRAASERSGRLRGLGIGMHMHVSGGFPAEFSLLRVDPDGRLMLHTGTQTGGQGHATVFAQIAAERLGLPVQAIAVQQGDTRALARGGGTGGSSSLPIAGVNIARAAELLIERGRAIAAQRFEAAPIDIDYSEGAYKVRGTDRRLGLFEMAVDEDVSAGCDFDGPTATFPNGAYAMEVEVDPATGAVRLCRFSGVDDLGRVLNPRIARGQIEGGVVQAIGQAMMEEVVYDANGQLLNASLMDYALPRAADVPALTVAFHEVPATTNPLGAKGAGEVGPAGGLAPFVAAVLDALRPLGVETLDMPATPENVWRAIERARTEKT